MYIKRAAWHLPQFVPIINPLLKVSFVHTEGKMRQPGNEIVAAFSAAATCLLHYVNVSVLIKFFHKRQDSSSVVSLITHRSP